jgi:hypothetical protein
MESKCGLRTKLLLIVIQFEDTAEWFVTLLFCLIGCGRNFQRLDRTKISVSDIITYHHHHWKNSPFWAIAFLCRFRQTGLFRRELDHPVFTLDFATVIFYRARSSALRPTPNLKDHVYGSQAPGSLFVAFYDSKWRYSNPPPHGTLLCIV